MVARDVIRMTDAIRKWEMDAGESFTDYFLDNYALGSWAYFLIGRGGELAKWGNYIIKVKNETKGGYVDQDVKFMWYDDYPGGDWCEDAYRRNVSVWADFLCSSDEYFERVNTFFNEYYEEKYDES